MLPSVSRSNIGSFGLAARAIWLVIEISANILLGSDVTLM
jgi:hypothetical protein